MRPLCEHALGNIVAYVSDGKYMRNGWKKMLPDGRFDSRDAIRIPPTEPCVVLSRPFLLFERYLIVLLFFRGQVVQNTS